MEFVYNLSNLIRTPSDFFHVLVYVCLVLLGFLVSLYVGNREEFNNYVYNPYLKHMYIKIRVYILISQLYGLLWRHFGSRSLQWTPIGNRMLYISNLCKKVFDRWFK